MKEAIGGVSLFQIVILFILIFTAIMCLTINHANAFGVKDEVITIIENETLADKDNLTSYNLSDNIINKIVEHLNNNTSYRVTGKCPDGDWVGYGRNGQTDNNAAFCIRAVDVAKNYSDDAEERCKNDSCTITSGEYPTMIYYEVVLFYQLDLPIIEQMFNFRIYGATKVLFG